jgi:Xaa-Pro aminopeptidase
MNRLHLKEAIRLVKQKSLDALLFTTGSDIFYLTGFNGDAGRLILTAGGEPLFFTNSLYKDAAVKIKGWTVFAEKRPQSAQIADALTKRRIKNLGFDPNALTVTEHKNLGDKLNTVNIRLVDAKNPLRVLRSIKSPSEVKAIKDALAITIEAVEYAREAKTDTTTEQGLSVEIDRFMRLKGDNSLAFPTIVAAGRNSAFPHHSPSAKVISNELFLTDLGAKRYGYCADLTRVSFSGKMPQLFHKVYTIVKKAQEIAIAKIKPGVKCSEIDKIARQFIEKHGYGKYFTHGLGHGVGLDVHEMPLLNAASQDILKEGMVVTVEPGIYLNNRFGVRIEDMVLVKPGKAELLSGAYQE